MTSSDSTDSIRFRLACPADIPAMMRIERIPEYRSFVCQYSAEHHAKLMASPDNAYWVVEEAGGEPIGFCLLRDLRNENKSVKIQRLALERTGSGLGRRFFAFLLEKIFDDYGAHRAWLDVFEGNPRARHLYRSFGFREDGVLRDLVLRDGRYYTHLLMSLLEDEYRQSCKN
jgi:RimJ/RimL family protein N-acetyltransferase